MAAAEDQWRAVRGITMLVLWVFEQNQPGRAFYEHLGWRPDGARQVLEIGEARPVEIRYRREL
jgi:GNAT superfamily N-acetyltransferase